MYDHPLFLRTLAEFAGKILPPYDEDAVIDELMTRLPGRGEYSD